VTSPKTEHHPGGDHRYIPIFPELRPHLLAVWEEASPRPEFVITTYRKANCNLRTQLCRYIRRAGLTPWPKLFHNLRSTRQTELAETFPIQVVCAWIGNSQAVAQDHYLQVMDAHFVRASHVTAPAASGGAKGNDIPGSVKSDALAELVRKWPALPHAVQERILGVAEGAALATAA
jgi:hypothetical protein